jgi:hypothetical protein
MTAEADNITKTKRHHVFRPGFRVNTFDFVFLLLGAVAASFGFSLKSLPAMIPAYVIFTFFLYCNVFRIRRSLELIWASAFTLSALSSFYFEQPSWPIVFGAGLALTIILIAIEMRHPSYHGIFWKFVNPNLPTWWNKKYEQQ